LLLDRHGRRPGARRLRAFVDACAQGGATRSRAERMFLALVQRARLPLPHTNVLVEGYEVDCLWRAQRLIVEVDGFAYHSASRSFDSDRRRDAALVAAGWRVMRVTWRQITGEPEAVAARIAQALARSGADRREA
jgi:very-short-patch-repair endonuclease